MVGWRLIDRLISLVSTPILARLLAPEDFGLVAMAMLAAGIVTVLLDLGVGTALIQLRSPTTEHYDSAWTLRMIQAAVMGSFVFAFAWPAASYFDEPRLVAVAQVVALSVAISGAENIGLVLLQKNFEFRRELRFFLARRVLSFAITIGLAFWLMNYWAVVIGAVATQIVSVVLSFRMHPFRPRLSLAKLRELLSFSQWMIVRGVGAYLSASLPSLMLGRLSGAVNLGIYRVSSELATLSSVEILAPLARVLYPALVEARESSESFRRAVSLALSVQFLITLPVCVGLAFVSNEVVAVFLGPKWTSAGPVLMLLALAGLFLVFQHTGGYALLAIGKIKVQAILTWIEAALFASLAAVLLVVPTPEAFALVRLASSTLMAWIFAFLLSRDPIGVPWRALLGSFARPMTACAAMAVCLSAFAPYAPAAATLALLSKVALGAAVYPAALALAWRIAGRPQGAETYLLAHARTLLSKIRR